ncbi:MAG: outer membrane beta-barrel protein [Sulfurovaceae bacterium]|nr:outer membrane beta-barrel protein [Sulfurovaceae bacterium]
MKKKFNKILLSLFILNSMSYASNDGITEMYDFIGIQTGLSSVSAGNKSGSDVIAPTIGFKYGQQTSEWRTAIYYNYAHHSDEKFQSLVAQVDHGVLMEAFTDLPFKPYVGFSIGMMQHKCKGDSNSDFIYGVNTGLNYVLNNTMDLDLSFQHMWTGSELKNLDGMNNLSLSLHYYFD